MQVMYQRGGVFVITSRILIVDLLTNVASPKDIDGVLVGHAESVTEQSTEAFILRIYKAQKQWSSSENPGFVKAFSDAPESLMAGFAKVDKILKSLHVQRLYLYPRFHASVSDELELSPPYVEELHQVCTYYNVAIHYMQCVCLLVSNANMYFTILFLIQGAYT
jgi:DNA excision repair protein ERCC-4